MDASSVQPPPGYQLSLLIDDATFDQLFKPPPNLSPGQNSALTLIRGCRQRRVTFEEAIPDLTNEIWRIGLVNNMEEESFEAGINEILEGPLAYLFSQNELIVWLSVKLALILDYGCFRTKCLKANETAVPSECKPEIPCEIETLAETEVLANSKESSEKCEIITESNIDPGISSLKTEETNSKLNIVPFEVLNKSRLFFRKIIKAKPRKVRDVKKRKFLKVRNRKKRKIKWIEQPFKKIEINLLGHSNEEKARPFEIIKSRNRCQTATRRIRNQKIRRFRKTRIRTRKTYRFRSKKVSKPKARKFWKVQTPKHRKTRRLRGINNRKIGLQNFRNTVARYYRLRTWSSRTVKSRNFYDFRNQKIRKFTAWKKRRTKIRFRKVRKDFSKKTRKKRIFNEKRVFKRNFTDNCDACFVIIFRGWNHALTTTYFFPRIGFSEMRKRTRVFSRNSFVVWVLERFPFDPGIDSSYLSSSYWSFLWLFNRLIPESMHFEQMLFF